MTRCHERMWGAALNLQKDHLMFHYYFFCQNKEHEISFWCEIKVRSPSGLKLQNKYVLRRRTCNLNEAEWSYAWNYMTSPKQTLRTYKDNYMWAHAVTGATESGTVSLFRIRHFHLKAAESTTAAKQVSRHNGTVPRHYGCHMSMEFMIFIVMIYNYGSQNVSCESSYGRASKYLTKSYCRY